MISKIGLFVQIISLLFSYSFSKIQTHQRFIFEKNNQNLCGEINLKKIEFNKTNENKTEKKLELIVEFSAINKNHKIFIRPLEDPCDWLNLPYTDVKYQVNNGKKEIHIIKKFKSIYREGINICLELNRHYYGLMKIMPLFHAKINFQPVKDMGEKDVSKLTKFEWFLNLEGNDSYIEICTEYKEKGSYIIALFITIEPDFRIGHASKALQFFIKVDKKLKKCISKTLKIESEEERNIFGELKKVINITIVKTLKNLTDGDIIKDEDKYFTEIQLFLGEYSPAFMIYCSGIKPLFDDESYEFVKDINGKIIEKRISSNNLIKNYMQPRELHNMPKNIFLTGIWQKWFFYDGKYFMMFNDGKAEEIKVT
uniref:Uncharacterized protein n=1 Tax=Meloidogyne hapla TaxID=6305 RepID=A0A1I8BS87_MELHA